MKLSTYVKEEWVGFGAKANKRQIPSLCDGLTKTSRKLLWALKNEKNYEIVERLGLKAAEQMKYQHGGTSIVTSLIGMVKSFPGTNNVPMFDGEGQFGHVVDSESSAPRYISCKISENYENWFNKKDYDILEKVVDRGETLEPVVMAPIAPLILVNGGFGIGSGFGCNIPNYSPEDVLKSVVEVLTDGFVSTPLVPSWVGWEGYIFKDPKSDNRFYPRGKFKRIDTSTLEVCCLPPSYDENLYKNNVLVPLYESGTIQSFDDESNELEGWKVIVHFKRGALKKYTDEELHKLLQTIHTRSPINLNLCCWDTTGKIKKYDYVEELVEEWVGWRLDIYEKRLAYEIQIIKEKIKLLLAKEFTINYFLGSSNAPKKDVYIEVLSEFDNSLTDKQIETLLNIPVMNMTKEGLEKSVRQKESLELELKELQSLEPLTYMLKEVKDLLYKYNGE